MSDNTYLNPRRDGWWGELGLSLGGGQIPIRHEREVEQAALTVLAAHPPVSFAGDAEGDTLTVAQLKELVERAVAETEREAERQRKAAPEERRMHGWARVDEALSGPDADQAVVEGRWAGFTRGEAIAWCWNLFQYEPHGFVHPGSQVRREAMKKLQAGGLPEVFGYPERAWELAAAGLTPRTYRRNKEAVGARTFAAKVVRHG